jgi:25S rRNA (adenine2142-N1)-methyltransferase
MLRRVVDFLHPNGAGLCYIVLPLPCITNSRYLNHDRFLAIVHAAGLGRCIHYHHSARLAYYLFQLDDEARMAIQKAPIKTSTQPISTRFPKKEICPGGRRNNFCIVLE